MVAYSFNKMFRDPILAGLEAGPWVPGMKRHTIRLERKRHARVGEAVQLYTGMRTRQCTLIGTAICNQVAPIHVYLSPADAGGRVSIRVPDAPLVYTTSEQLDHFARCDGFTDWAELLAFWARAHPDTGLFVGVIVNWEPAHVR